VARYWFDTEFHEYPGILKLISIGIVCEDGREYYAQNSTTDLSIVNDWVREHVLPQLLPYGDPCWKTLAEIRRTLIEFFADDPSPEIWGWYADYDWVLFCWTIAGPMVALPEKFPRYCLDLRQTVFENQIDRDTLPPDPTDVHNALSDSRWLKSAWEQVEGFINAGRE
jgi:hypothetical protein